VGMIYLEDRLLQTTLERLENQDREQEDKKELVKACFYDDPLLGAAQRYADSGEWKAVGRLCSINRGKALDVGAGRGISSYALAGDGWQVTALEPDASDLVGAGAIRSLVAESGCDIEVVETWGETLPFPDNTFDLVYCRATLHHARDLKGLCREACRVLKPSGQFISTREHVISKHEDLNLFLKAHPLHALYGGEHAYLLSEYTDAIRFAGFKIEKILNPMASAINLYPQTLDNLKENIAFKLRIPKFLVSDFMLKFLANFSNSPGRHYSFVAKKI